MQTKQQHGRKESKVRLTRVPATTAEKLEQQLYGHVFLGREWKIQVMDCMSHLGSKWNQHLPVTM